MNIIENRKDRTLQVGENGIKHQFEKRKSVRNIKVIDSINNYGTLFYSIGKKHYKIRFFVTGDCITYYPRMLLLKN